jgi:DNA-binding transcriptional LysR family regulator
MDRLVALRLFLRIAETGSITGAGRAIGLSRTAASRGLAELEAALGLRLVDRTTRHATATEAGRTLQLRLAAVLGELDAALDQARTRHDTPAGTLRVVARRSYALRHVVPRLAAFRAAHPAVEIDLTLTEAPGLTPTDGIDVAIRLGEPAEKSFISHRLADGARLLCAAPSYLAAHPAPATPADLAEHACLGYRREAEPVVWHAEGPAGASRIPVRGPLRANSGEALRLAALDGLGLALLPAWMVAEDLAAGRLLALLQGWRLTPLGYHEPICAVHAAAPHVPAKITAFIAHLRAGLSPEPGY